jgi:chemotaxis protein methyltransferase CheR
LLLDELCRISISRFYRDRRVFDLLRDEVLVELATSATARGDNQIAAWSLGCASGEEVYTLKLIWELGLQRRFPSLSLSITASDANPHMLKRAQQGRYPTSSVKDFPEEWMPLAFEEADGEFRIREPFRGGIEFVPQDVRQQQPAGPFDLILCRHLVFTYFEESLQAEVLRQITARLRSNGVLVIGKQETLPPSAISNALHAIWPRSGIYRWEGG